MHPNVKLKSVKITDMINVLMLANREIESTEELLFDCEKMYDHLIDFAPRAARGDTKFDSSGH